MNRLISTAAVLRNSLRIHPDHFRRDLPRDRAIELFRDHVELIEIETNSYCNRTCAFCPNVSIDRRSERNPMPDDTWQAILTGLRELDFAGTIVWSRYAEALAQKDIVDRVRAVHEAAPKARLAMNSNGDYLTPTLLEELADAGMERIWVDIYLPDDQPYTTELAQQYLDKFLSRVKRGATITGDEPELTGTLDVDRIEVLLVCRNLDSMSKHQLSDRGGLVKIANQVQRTSPCYAPYKHLVIDWDGSVIPCCQLRSDTPQHAGYVAGRVGKDFGLVDAYASLAGWRESLRGFGPKASPCNTCNVSQYSDDAFTVMVSATLAGDSRLGTTVRAVVGPLVPKRARF